MTNVFDEAKKRVAAGNDVPYQQPIPYPGLAIEQYGIQHNQVGTITRSLGYVKHYLPCLCYQTITLFVPYRSLPYIFLPHLALPSLTLPYFILLGVSVSRQGAHFA
jgi:hypothetical protein